MNRYHTIVFLFIFFVYSSHLVLAQSIDELPQLDNIDEISGADIDSAFNIAHSYSESIYNSYKMSSIPETLPVSYSLSRWGVGSWGQGYFSVYVDQPLYNCNDLGNCPAAEENYNIWKNDVLSNHPLMRESARRTMAYIHKYSTTADTQLKATYLNRIIAGSNYLIQQQIKKSESANYEGAFIWWKNRPDIATLQQTDIPSSYGSNSYVTGLCLRALAETYLFLNTNNLFSDNTHRLQLLNAITKAARWLSNRSFIFDTSDELSNNVNPPYTINYKANCIWGLLGAYRVTKKAIYLNRAAYVYERCLKDWQMADGVWDYAYDSEPYHNSKPGYTGMIIRAITELNILIPDNSNQYLLDIKSSTGNCIIHTINHFLTADLGKDGNGVKTVRLQHNGTIVPYYKDPSFYNQPGGILIQGLIYCNYTSVLTSEDKLKVRGIINSLLNNRIYSDNVIADIDMLSLAMYNDNFLPDINQSNYSDKIVFYNRYGVEAQQEIDMYDLDNGLINRGHSNSGIHFDLMANGDFDGNGETDIALYRKSDGRITIYNAFGPYTGTDQLGSISTQNGTYDLMERVDYNYDGVDELVLYSSVNNHEISIYELNNGTPVTTGHSNTGIKFDNLTIGNYDSNDIKDDLAFYRKSDGKITIYQPGVAYQGSNQVGSILTGVTDFDLMESVDYDIDGVNEIIMYSNSLNKLINIYGLNKPAPIHSGNSNSGKDWTAMIAGDFDNNKEIDIAMYKKDDGKITIYQPGSAYTGEASIGGIHTDITNYLLMGSIKNMSTAVNSNGRIASNLAVEPDEDDLNNSILIYPNPTQSILHIKTGEYSDPVNVSFLDENGKTIFSGVEYDNKIQIDISRQKSGVYHLIIQNNKMRENFQILIK